MLNLQSPVVQESPNLLEHLLDAVDGKHLGASAFAWATEQGARLLLEDPEFEQFLAVGEYTVVVGVDAITTPRAIELLSHLSERHKKLSVHAFIHARKGAMFHPKVSWFAGKKRGALLAGSGNLTVAGLRANWEAFASVALNASQVAAVKKEWDSWFVAHKGYLKELDDPAVADAVAKNKATFTRRSVPAQAATVLDGSNGLDEADGSVLVAEIPKASTRWNQANFSQAVYTGYFGAKIGSRRRIVLQHVSASGQIGALESRPSVDVASSNYRFELGAASGLKYPSSGRPIGIFAKTQFGTILYTLLLPGDSGHSVAHKMLTKYAKGPKGQVRRLVTSTGVLRAEMPALPLLSASVLEE